MSKDPILEEIRQFRRDYSEKFNHDLGAMCRDLREKQDKAKRKVISFPPRRPRRRSSGSSDEQS